MIIKIESHILRALNACVAGKADPRFLLQGLCLDLTEQGNPLLVSTNGHALLAAPVEVVSPDNAPGETSIWTPVKVPRRKFPVDVTLELTDAVEGLVSWGSTSERPRRIDGTYPNWRRILRGPNKKGAHERIGLDTRNLAPIATELNAYCALEFGESPMDQISVQWGSHPDLICAVMPCRI